MSSKPATENATASREDKDTSTSPAGTTEPNQNGSSDDKKRKAAEEDPATKQEPASDRPMSKRKRLEERHQKLKRRTKAPASAFSRRDRSRSPENTPDAGRGEPPRRSTSPIPPARSPTPEAQARQRKRPGGGSRMGIANREILRRRQEERERAETEDVQKELRERGVSDLVRQHYNTVPERGKEWRRTESKIKGLRSFNNWIKSTLIQKFSPDEEFIARVHDSKDWAEDAAPPPVEEKRLLVLDLGCGKGGDLGKWQQAPQTVDLYVGLDPAEISVDQARDRYNSMRSSRGRGRRSNSPLFYAEFHPKDCFGEWAGEIPIIQQVGIDPSVGPGGSMMSARWGGGGFDVVSSMFTIHYAFENEEKTRQMLSNVAGSLKKGGRFIGVCPNSDAISARVEEFHKKRKARESAKAENHEIPEDGEVEEEMGPNPEWGNSLYRVKFPGPTPEDGVFRPPFGWKYSYYMEEAVEEVPEYVVPWEAFRA